MNNFFKTLLSLILLTSCYACKEINEQELLVRVNDKSLTRTEVMQIIPHNLSASDSLLFAENYIKKWVKDALIYQVAKQNIEKASDEIEQLVEDYRRALYRNRYQELLIKTKLTAEIKEDEMMAVYQQQPEKFVLDKNLIKGLFMKVSKESPEMDKVRKWIFSTKPESIELLEKYSIQNGAIFDCFYDRWVDFDEVISRIPIHHINKSQFLKTKKSLETTDSTYIYFLSITENILAGEMTPYDYAQTKIQEMIINKRKTDFIKHFEEDLYRDAIRKGHVTFYHNE